MPSNFCIQLHARSLVRVHTVGSIVIGTHSSVTIITLHHHCHHCRPPVISHDHCYIAATQERAAEVVAMETESATPTITSGGSGEERSKSVADGDKVKDNRKCLLCPVEGDAGCMVRWLRPYDHTP